MSDRGKSRGRDDEARAAASGQPEEVVIVNPSTEERKTIKKSEWNRTLREQGWQRLDGNSVTETRQPDPAPTSPVTETPEGDRPAGEARETQEFEVEGSRSVEDAFGQ